MECLTPMMRQYMDVKNDYKDCLLLYRLGDFYEMFFDDAITASKELEITLTGKDCGLEERAPMCGVPHHSVQNYIAKLVTNGHKVAICEQMEDPATAKGIVKRDVVRVITPGTVIESNILDEKKNNYIAAIYKLGTYYGLAYSDVSTGEFCTTEIVEGNNFSKLVNELVRFNPAEIVVNEDLFVNPNEIKEISEKIKTYVTMTSGVIEDLHIAGYESLEKMPYAREASKLLFAYIKETQKIDMKHISNIEYYTTTKYMVLDSIARRNLELTETIRDRSKKGSLLWVLDKTSTSMGGRLLRRWIEKPLTDIGEIELRLDGVEELKSSSMKRGELIDVLKKVYDIERLTGKVAYGTVNAKDLIALKHSLVQLPLLKKVLASSTSKLLKEMYESLDELEDVASLIEAAIVEEPPVSVKEGGIIKPEYDEEVKRLRMASTEGKSWVVSLEAKEREETGIKNLKVGFNKVFGYYIEVSKSNVSLVPDRYIRKQTLTNGERYITNELKEIESTILGAEDKVINLEYEIFVKIRDEISLQIKRLQQSSNAVASIDVLCSLAEVAEKNNYKKPEVDESDDIIIKEGRHPVVEALIPTGMFVPNDTTLNQREDRVNIITGPNMAGKSTYMRQVALISLMAQIGSFVPADYAKIGIVDRIFTRVGASDDLASGQSTFMVEMNEVANIISNATRKSLLILDEIGRGTSTFDGLSIAWAVVEHIADKEKIGARTLFATHYHELTELETKIDGVKNYCIAVKEKGEDVIFLRKIIRGGADESYGVHVAKLAGIPNNVTHRANEIMKTLKENNFVNNKAEKEPKKAYAMQSQFDLFNYKLGEIASEIDKINVNELTPIEALNTLMKLKMKL
ncbi:MAG: DNA mismatch repair protein MutS [Clostridia bacterium]|nr:DNA mismatch repair protein MutS [Clostridia bacterium]